MLVHDVTIKPEVLDELRDRRRHLAVLDGSFLERWKQKFARAEILQNWEVQDLADILFIGRLPVGEMTGASKVTAYHNPGGKAETGGGPGYRIEHVTLALLRLYAVGVRVPEALPLAMALRSRIAKKPILTDAELRIFWAEQETKACLSCTALRWPAGMYADAFSEPEAVTHEAEAKAEDLTLVRAGELLKTKAPPRRWRRLADGRFYVRCTGRDGSGFELVFKDLDAKLKKELLRLGTYSGAFAELDLRFDRRRQNKTPFAPFLQITPEAS